MSEPTHPIVDLSDEQLDALLRGAVRLTLALGLVLALILWIASSWKTAVMMAIGASISAASILEWRRLLQLINAKLDQKKTPRGAALAITFFLLRLLVFAGVIYGSLKCLDGSVVALLCGLCLSVAVLAWQTLRLLRD